MEDTLTITIGARSLKATSPGPKGWWIAVGGQEIPVPAAQVKAVAQAFIAALGKGAGADAANLAFTTLRDDFKATLTDERADLVTQIAVADQAMP